MSDFNQWSSLGPILGRLPADAQVGANPGNAWMSDEDKARITAYTTYEKIYWNDLSAFALIRRGADIEPIVLPRAMAVVDATAHYFLKDFSVKFDDAAAQKLWEPFSKRELFYPRFHIAKHSGVVRGDWIMHMTGDPSQKEGKRVSLVSVDPSMYFPIYDDDDMDKRIGVNLAYCFNDKVNGKNVVRLRKKVYREEDNGRISVEDGIYELNQRLDRVRWVMEPMELPKQITAIPVYHFQNRPWESNEYGSSELRGHERILAGTSQTVSDEEVALALDGLGVWVTDGGKPTDSSGNPTDWVIAPAAVMEVTPGSYFKRAEGIKSVEPMGDHIDRLEQAMFEATQTFRAGELEAAQATSGLYLQLKFSPTQAKLEVRDAVAVDKVGQMVFDWTQWQDAYESSSIGEKEPTVSLGDKLPVDKDKKVAELNNMFDRKIITRQYYRDEMEKLGYTFPDDIENELKKEADQAFEQAQRTALLTANQGPPAGDPQNPNAPSVARKNRSRNRGRVNESNGSEAGQKASSQARGSK